MRPALRFLLSRWRQWDWIAAQRVDRYVSNSRTTAERVRRYLGRESTVLHPPVELAPLHARPVGAHYVVLAELMAHKRIDVAVEAFNRIGLPLVVIGDGPEGRRLRRLAGPSVTFTGRIPDPQVAEVLAGARAIVVTAVEEFGIAAVEALAAGRPVIAFGDGGVRESVQPGVTGVFYERNDPAALAETVLAFDALARRLRRLPRRGRAVQRAALPERARGDRGRRRLGRAPAAAGASGRCSRPGCSTAGAARAGGRSRHAASAPIGKPLQAAVQELRRGAQNRTV